MVLHSSDTRETLVRFQVGQPINTAMKITDLLEDSAEQAARNVGRRSREMGMSGRLTDTHFNLAYNAVKREELDKAEINDLAKELADHEEYGRSADSAQFVLNRMHILVHGVAPHGETEKRAETMFSIPKTMVQFANEKGLDTDFNIEHAREELRNRPARVKRPEAMKMMSDYYMKNKDSLPKNVRDYREDIIELIMKGTSPELAFKSVA